MRNITGKIATSGFCALETGAADLPGRLHRNRLKSAEACLFSDGSRVIREIQDRDQADASTPLALVEKQSLAVLSRKRSYHAV